MSTVEDWGGSWFEVKSKGMSWPAGRQRVPGDRLKELLAMSARWHARTAIRTFGSDEYEDLLQASVSVGSAVEHLTKSYLASISPALLADRGDRDSVLMLDGSGHLFNSDPLKLRSLGAIQAVQYAKHLNKDLPIDLPDPIAFRVRNAATHMALVDANDLHKATSRMATIVDHLLGVLDLDRSHFWGEVVLPAVDDLIDLAKTETAQLVASKKVAAQIRLAQLTKAMPAEGVAAILAALSGRQVRVPSTNEVVKSQACPICGQQAWLLCEIERSEVQFAGDWEGNVEYWVDRAGYPFMFECPVCQFELEGDELDLFDFPAEVEMDSDEPTVDEMSDLYDRNSP